MNDRGEAGRPKLVLVPLGPKPFQMQLVCKCGGRVIPITPMDRDGSSVYQCLKCKKRYVGAPEAIKPVHEHQPCDQQPVSVRCSFAGCCWHCDRGYCHHFYVFGNIPDSCRSDPEVELCIVREDY